MVISGSSVRACVVVASVTVVISGTEVVTQAEEASVVVSVAVVVVSEGAVLSGFTATNTDNTSPASRSIYSPGSMLIHAT